MHLRISEPNANKRLAEIDSQTNCYHADGFCRTIIQVLGPMLDLLPHFVYNCIPVFKATASFSSLLVQNDYNLLGRKITHMHGIGGIKMDYG